MPSKGPSGSTTVTQTNTPFNAPYLNGLYQNVANDYTQYPVNYYPGQTLATFDPNLQSGYQNLAQTGAYGAQTLGPVANSTLTNILSGGVQDWNGPAYSGFQNFASGQAAPVQSLQNFAGVAADNNIVADLSPYMGQLDANSAAAFANPALSSLTQAANGAFLGTNPYIEGEYNAAADPMVRQYMTATAPQTDSAFEAAGRYGSGALANAQSQNEQNLGKSLGDLSANLYGQDYANERNLMTQAGGLLGNLYTGGVNASTGAVEGAGNLGLGAFGQQLSGLGLAGTLDQGAMNGQLAALTGLQSGYDTGNHNMLLGLGVEPSVLQASLIGPNAQIAAGQGLTGMSQQQINDAMNRFYGNEMAPWNQLQMVSGLFGQAIPGTSTQTQPYFTNPLSGILGGAMGLNSMLGSNGLFGSSGMFGANGMFGSNGALFGSGGLLGGLLGGDAAATAAPMGIGDAMSALTAMLPLA